MTDEEHARKYAEESISLAVSMTNPMAETIARLSCLYGLTYKNDEIKKLKEQLEQANNRLAQHIVELQKDKGRLIDENNKLLDVINEQDVKIADLEEQNSQMFNTIALQEQQIEKMKCCENCKYNSYWGDELHCNYGLKEALQEDKLVECHNLDKWEIK